MVYALGIDLGGTKVLAGLIDTETGEILSTAVQPTRAEHGPDNVLLRLLAVAEDAVARSAIEPRQVEAIGIGAAGQVDSDRGMLLRAPNLPDSLTRVPITDAIEDRLHCPARLVNDVEAAAAGEATFGAGKGRSDFVCIFVGTGIGGAVYQGGVPYRGASNTAGELGHMVVEAGGRLCGCGGQGHLEAYASRTAIVRRLLGALRLGRESVLAEQEPDPDPANPALSRIGHLQISRAVAAHDPLVLEVIDEAAWYMASGLVSIINFYNPPRIILGGGVVGELPRFFEQSREKALHEALVVPRQSVDIVQAQMGEYPGIVGAAVLAARSG